MMNPGKTVWVATMVVLAASGAGVAAPPPKAPATADSAAMTVAASSDEQKLMDFIRATAAAGKEGVRAQLATQQWRPLALREAALRAVQHNLVVQRGKLADAQAQAALQEASAVFDPVFVLAAQYDQLSLSDRIEHTRRYGKGTQPRTNANGETVNAVEFEEGVIDYVAFEQAREAGFRNKRVDANRSSPTGPQKSWDYQLSWQQQLPWGLALDLGLGALRRETFYGNNTSARIQGYDSYGSYRRPWTASAQVNLRAPLPWARNSGSYALADVTAGKGDSAYRQARAQVANELADTLLAVDAAYWDLVARGRGLQISHGHLDNTNEMMQRSNRLFDQNQITAQEHAHMAAALARVQAAVEQAWYDYSNASRTLAALLDIEPGAVLLPYAYGDDQVLDVDAQVQAPADPAAHPLVQAATSEAQVAELEYRYRRREAAPDISLNGGVSIGHNPTVFGFASADEAISRLDDPDYRTIQYSVSYVYPLGNNAADAARDQARYRYDAAQALRAAAGNAARRRLGDAGAQLQSARQLLTLQRHNVELAALMHDKVSGQQQARVASAYELVIRNDELLAARQQLVAAEVEVHLAGIRLLAAQGRLAGAYARYVAANEADEQRVVWLQRSGVLRYFQEAEL